jgi:hypothetical protein
VKPLFKQRWFLLYAMTAALYFLWVLVILFADRRALLEVNYIPIALTNFPILEVCGAGFVISLILYVRRDKKHPWVHDRKRLLVGCVLLAGAALYIMLMLGMTGDAIVRRGIFHYTHNWLGQHRYNLAADYQRYYYLYECDSLGIQCRLLFSEDLFICTDIDLPVNPETNTIYIRGNCGSGTQIIDTYQAGG